MSRIALFLALCVGCGLLAGCSPDKSGDTQSMPKSASAPNESPKMPAGIPDQAKSAISKAAPPPSGN